MGKIDPKVGLERFTVFAGQSKYIHIGPMRTSVVRQRPYFPPVPGVTDPIPLTAERGLASITDQQLVACVHLPSSVTWKPGLAISTAKQVVAQGSGCVDGMQGKWLLHSSPWTCRLASTFDESTEDGNEPIRPHFCSLRDWLVLHDTRARWWMHFVSHLQMRTGRHSFRWRQAVALFHHVSLIYIVAGPHSPDTHEAEHDPRFSPVRQRSQHQPGPWAFFLERNSCCYEVQQVSTQTQFFACEHCQERDDSMGKLTLRSCMMGEPIYVPCVLAHN